MARKKKPEEESEGIAEGALRDLGFGGLIDFALKSPVFEERFREINKEIEEKLSEEAEGGRARPSTRLSIRPRVESSYSVRYIREEKGREWKPATRKLSRKLVQKIVAEEPEEIEPPVDVFEEKNRLKVVAELPRVHEEDIKVEVKEDKLTISTDAPDRKYHREVLLPIVVEAEPTKLTYRNGVLEIDLKKEKLMPFSHRRKGGIRMRKLVHIPIVHGAADMGSIKEEVRRASMALLGEQRWVRKEKEIEKFWDRVEAEVNALDLDYSKVRIYQDGLPCAGELGMKIVNAAAASGSRNFQILKRLIDQGAILEAAESAELLMKEYAYIKKFMSAESLRERADAKRQYGKIRDELIKKRDEFIAKKIDATLKEGETGILFIGAIHKVEPKLPADIHVVHVENIEHLFG